MTAGRKSPSRQEALSVLRDGFAKVSVLIRDLTGEEACRGGLGGGDWSVKDLIGHLTSWEGYAVEAIESWQEDRPAGIDRALRAHGLNGVNDRAVHDKSSMSWAEIRSDFHGTHARLVELIESIDDGAWSVPPTSRSLRALGERLGSILAGPGRFDHVDAHMADLERHTSSLAPS